jgi:hypothetical protein
MHLVELIAKKPYVFIMKGVIEVGVVLLKFLNSIRFVSPMVHTGYRKVPIIGTYGLLSLIVFCIFGSIKNFTQVSTL